MPEADPRRIRSLFDQALALPKAARHSFLATRCGGDAGLRQRLQAMLEAAEDPRFLATPTKGDHEIGRAHV